MNRRRLLQTRGEGGYVLALSAMMVVPLLIISAMAVDFGGWYTQGARMQRAADAAALAGVVWLPDLTTATTKAKSVAASNGYAESGTVTIAVSKMNDYEIKVVITDSAADVFLAQFVKQTVNISRTATAKYVLPVPLGSPRNYFGSGAMVTGSDTYGSKAENFFAAINGRCAAKAQGDPFATAYSANTSTSSACSAAGRTANPDYESSDDQYEYYITVPAGRSNDILLNIWNPADKNTDTTDPAPSTYNADATTTFKLRGPDNTPLDDSDNPTFTCSGTGQSNPREYTATDNDRTILSTAGWSDFCTIPTTASAGKYILGVKTSATESSSTSWGFNNYSVMASYTNAVGTTCDSRTSSTCPTVSGKNWISIYANSTTSASFYLAEVGQEYASKTLQITLFDPGEGGTSIRIKDPSGSYATFSAYNLGADGTGSTLINSSTSTLDVTNLKYNGLYVQLNITLPANYGASLSQFWWKIEYNYSGTVTDRTTWGVQVLGNPVHLTS